MQKLEKIRKNGAYITSIGLDKIKLKLEELKRVRRVEISQRIQKARDFGDLTENAEYDAALDEQAIVEERIKELEEVLIGIQIIKEVPKSDFVVIGSTVAVEMDGEKGEFTIVGKVEADPSKKRISNESPLGAILLGAKVGETVEVATPIVRYKCKVLEIK